MFLLLALRIAAHFLWPETRGHLALTPHESGDPIVFGCLLALYEGSEQFERARTRFVTWQSAIGGVLFLLAVNPLLEFVFHGMYISTAGPWLTSLAIILVVVWCTNAQSCTVTRILNARLVKFFGTLSYSLYLWQQIFLPPYALNGIGELVRNLFFCSAAALFSLIVIERPFLSLREKIRPARSADRKS